MRWLAASALVSLLGAFLSAAQTPPPSSKPAPEQPLPFSHKHHAGTLQLACKTCHPNPDPGESMTIATPSVCMQCHASVKTGSPAIVRLAAAAKGNGQAIKWAPVYAIPSYVFFSHRAHADAGNTCAECHGPVPERERLAREGDISMGGCMRCHQAKKASNDCSFCHEPR